MEEEDDDDETIFGKVLLPEGVSVEQSRLMEMKTGAMPNLKIKCGEKRFDLYVSEKHDLDFMLKNIFQYDTFSSEIYKNYSIYSYFSGSILTWRIDGVNYVIEIDNLNETLSVFEKYIIENATENTGYTQERYGD